MSDFFSLPLQIQLSELFFSLGRLRFDSGPQNWQLYYLLQKHVALSINLNFKVVHDLVFRNEIFSLNLRHRLPLALLFLVLLGWHFYLLRHQKVATLLLCARGRLRKFNLGVLIGDLIVDDLNGSLKDEGQL